jgi:LysM repeat protein
MENINKKDFSRIYELMSFDRGKTLYEMEKKWDNILNEETAPGGLKGAWDPATKTYTIAKGEYLSKIAKAFGVDWKKMYEANKSTLKSGDPNLVYVGEKLVINDFGGSSSSTTESTASTSASTATTVTLKYDANALLYYAYERRNKSMEPGGDLENSEKYGNLALYFQDVRDNKAQDVTKYKLTQADVDKFISEFEKMIAGNTELLNKYIENGKNTTVTNIAGRLEFKTKTPSKVPGDVNGDGIVNASDLPPDQTMNNGRTTAGGEDLDYDADAEGFEEQEPEMDREIDTTRTMEIKPSNNGWEDFFAKQFGK